VYEDQIFHMLADMNDMKEQMKEQKAQSDREQATLERKNAIHE